MIVPQEQLTAAAVAGDTDALTALLGRHDRDLRGWLGGQIGRRYRSAFDTDDILQVTYLEVFLRIRQFERRGTGSFQAWIRCIAETNLKDAIRELNRKKRPSPARRTSDSTLENSSAALLATLVGSGTTPTAGVARLEADVMIEDALDKLPPHYAEVVRLYDLQGLSADETATRMGKTRASIHMLKARAHDRLGEILGGSTNFFSKGS